MFTLYLTETNIIEKRDKQKSFLLYSNYIITILLSAVLLFSGINKIIAPIALLENLTTTFKFLPENLFLIIAALLPMIEIALGVFLVFSLYKESLSKYKKIINLSVVVLFGLFFVYGIYSYIIGLSNDCGCFGDAIKSGTGFGVILRNTFLLILAIFIFTQNRTQDKFQLSEE